MTIQRVIKYYIAALAATASITLGPEIAEMIRLGGMKLFETVF